MGGRGGRRIPSAWFLSTLALAGAAVAEAPGELEDTPAFPSAVDAEFWGCRGVQGSFYPLGSVMYPAWPPEFRPAPGPYPGSTTIDVAVLHCDRATLGGISTSDFRVSMTAYHVIPPAKYMTPEADAYVWTRMGFDQEAHSAFFGEEWDFHTRHVPITISVMDAAGKGSYTEATTGQPSARTEGCYRVLRTADAAEATEHAGTRIRLFETTTGTNAALKAIIDVERSAAVGGTGAVKGFYPPGCSVDTPYSEPVLAWYNVIETGQGGNITWPEDTPSFAFRYAGPLTPTEGAVESASTIRADTPPAEPEPGPPAVTSLDGSVSSDLADRDHLALSLALVAVAAVYFLRFELFRWLTVVLFSRVRQDQALDHPRRSLLLAYVTANPGSSFTDVRRDLGIGSGPLVHHLRILEKTCHVRVVRAGARTRLYAVGTAVDATPPLTDVQRRIVSMVSREPGIDQSRLARRMRMPRENVAYHLHRLASSGRVASSKDGRHRRYYPAESARPK